MRGVSTVNRAEIIVRCVRAVASPDGCLSPIEINEVLGDEALLSGGEVTVCQVARLVRSFTRRSLNGRTG